MKKHAIEVTVDMDLMTDRRMERVDHAIGLLRDIPGVAVTGWCDPEPRYDTILSDPDIPGHPSGMIGVIDENRGGIIAWAVDQAQADALIAQLVGD